MARLHAICAYVVALGATSTAAMLGVATAMRLGDGHPGHAVVGCPLAVFLGSIGVSHARTAAHVEAEAKGESSWHDA